MAYKNEKCVSCGRTLANSKYITPQGSKCPICVLGEEGKQSKYWEISQETKPEGFRYPDDTAKYFDKWDKVKKKWVKLDGSDLDVSVSS